MAPIGWNQDVLCPGIGVMRGSVVWPSFFSYYSIACPLRRRYITAGNTSTTSVTGTTPHAANNAYFPPVTRYFTGTVAGNRHYSIGTMEEPLPEVSSPLELGSRRSPRLAWLWSLAFSWGYPLLCPGCLLPFSESSPPGNRLFQSHPSRPDVELY